MMQHQKRSSIDQEKVPHLLLDQHTPQHADFPFHIVHLYHCQLDIYSESSLPEEILGIPRATFAIDAYSRSQLAVFNAFDLPGYASYLMILRECVRRHGRLPQILIVDEGSDHNNAYFEYFLSMCGITKVERPLAEPDKGSPIEHLFGMTDTDFIVDVLNSTQTSESLLETNDPDLRATWPLDVFSKRMYEWCYDVYDNRSHPALGRTPREVFQAGMLLSEMQHSRRILYDEKFRILTLPMGRMARVNPRKGVKVLGEYYWSEAFRFPLLDGAKVPIRYDPAEMSHVFAFAKGQWFQCKRVRWIPVLD
jgi:putative transposase